MHTSRINTFFHIVGAACLIFGGLLILIALDQGDTASTIPLAMGGILVAVSLYCLAGAPQLSKALRRRFPNLEPVRRQASQPRHKTKAILGMSTGALMGIAPLIIVIFGLLPKGSPDSTGEIFLLLLFFAPIASVWGGAHWSWHKGSSPKIPILIGGVCLLLMSPLAWTHNIAVIVAGYTLLTLSPTLAALLTNRSPRRTRRH